MKAADAAVAGGDMHAAVRYYAMALEHDEALARDSAFMGRYAAAESRVAYDQAVQQRTQGEYEQAAQQLRLSIEKDASYKKPAELLHQVLIEASAIRYVQAVAAADRGQQDAARMHLGRALQQNPKNQRAAAAMASLTPGGLPDDTPGLAVYRQALQDTAAKRWPQAIGLLKQSVGQGPGLLSARIALHDAQRELSSSQRLAGEANALINERSIGPALDRLRLATEVWPFNERAIQLTQDAQQLRDQADTKLSKATDLAGKRQWEEAIAMVESALAIDRSHAGARKALSHFKEVAASDYVEQGETLLKEGRLLKAEKMFGRATELDQKLASAATGLGQARSRMTRSIASMQAGAGHIKVLQLSGAITSLNQSLEMWAFNLEAQALLAQAKEQQEQARQRFETSARFANASRWDDAIALADEALALDRSFDGLAGHRRQLPQRAAVDYTTLANKSLEENALEDARLSYHKALSYVPRYGPALSGLASVYHARGKAHEAQERFGAALLEYTLGKSYRPEHAVGKSWELARHLVRDRVGMGVSVEVDPGRGGAVGPDQLGRSLAGVLSRYRGYGLEVNGKAAPYTLLVKIGRAEIDTRLVGSVNRTHEYCVREQRHNRDYDRAVSRLEAAISDLQGCKAEYDRALCAYNDAKRRADGLNPGATPRKPAMSRPSPPADPNDPDAYAEYLRQLQRYEHLQAEYQRALSDYNRKAKKYRSAQSQASSLGSKSNSLRSTVSSREREVRSCKHRLSNTPKKIWVEVPYTWNYIVQTHKKTGDLAVTSQLIDNTTGKAIDQTGHHADFNDTDTMRLNANPDIGLRRDSLDLASDSQVRSALTSELARDASPWAVQAAVKHRLDDIFQSIGRLEKAKNYVGALEARVDAAVLTGVVDQTASSRLLTDLAKRYAGPAD